MAVAEHECKCKLCGKTIHQGESVKTLRYAQICGPNLVYHYHPQCHAKVMKHAHEVAEFYKWKAKNQKKLDRKRKVKGIIRKLRRRA